MERLVLLLQQKQGGQEIEVYTPQLFIIALGQEAMRSCHQLAHALRRGDLRVAMDLEGRSLKSQMKQADRSGAGWVLIVGDNELRDGQGVLRNMQTQDQRPVALEADILQGILQPPAKHLIVKDRSIVIEE
jgi:histidyl-tRNA synthetase